MLYYVLSVIVVVASEESRQCQLEGFMLLCLQKPF
jgi:hypothetical protein